MDVSPSPTPSRGRRSFPNLTHLSLAPLSSRFPIDDDGYEEPDPVDDLPRSSYIQGKSAPTTPGILGGGSKPRTKKKSKYAHDSYFPPGSTYLAPITKAKSASALAPRHERLDPPSPLLSMHVPPPIAESNDEWLHRAGLVIAGEARESKGQSWLVSRESSTSLVALDEDESFSLRQDIRPVINSRQASRAGSRVGSRVGSAKPSRRGSRVGSRMELLTPFESRTLGVERGYFEEELGMEPDFVEDEDEEGVAAESEVKQLSDSRVFGFGGLVDRLLGWPLFNVDEDSEDEDKIRADETAEELQRRKQRELKRRKEALAKAASDSANATTPRLVVQPRQNQDEEGGWNDVTWLLSVASKVIL
jgi:hypothetical protein